MTAQLRLVLNWSVLSLPELRQAAQSFDPASTSTLTSMNRAELTAFLQRQINQRCQITLVRMEHPKLIRVITDLVLPTVIENLFTAALYQLTIGIEPSPYVHTDIKFLMADSDEATLNLAKHLGIFR